MTLTSIGKFSIDIQEALRSGVYASGTTGCGKSDIMMYCADALQAEQVTVIIFDPSQDWISRYTSANSVSFKSYALARYVETISLVQPCTIVDTSNLTILQTQELIELFSRLLYEYQAKKSPQERKQIFVIFEEAHVAFPQGCLRATKFQNTVRLLTVGRNFNVRIGMVTQFASMLDKSGLRFMRQRFFGATDEFNDVRYLSAMVGDEQAESLKYLSAGEFLYVYPAKQVSEKIKINPYQSKTLSIPKYTHTVSVKIK